MNVIWTLEARDDLRTIHDYIADHSEIQAVKQIDRIRVRWMYEKPVRGHPVHEFPESGCLEVHEGKYRIIHRVEDEKIYIVTVIHMRQMLNLDRLL